MSLPEGQLYCPANHPIPQERPYFQVCKANRMGYIRLSNNETAKASEASEFDNDKIASVRNAG